MISIPAMVLAAERKSLNPSMRRGSPLDGPMILFHEDVQVLRPAKLDGRPAEDPAPAQRCSPASDRALRNRSTQLYMAFSAAGALSVDEVLFLYFVNT
jgi:hypothetical protein